MRITIGFGVLALLIIYILGFILIFELDKGYYESNYTIYRKLTPTRYPMPRSWVVGAYSSEINKVTYGIPEKLNECQIGHHKFWVHRLYCPICKIWYYSIQDDQ